jgi:hypothetical protein
MTLTDLMVRANKLGEAITVADEAHNHADFDRLWDERASLHAFASHLSPTDEAEAHFLGHRIVEYAEFLRDVPTHEAARIEALAAIKRMSDALAEWAAMKEHQRDAA